ncbi:Rhodopsin, GQ-coupled [Trichoplax sp. H2]|nr:Rhodopsin, GQ-coupled [Trichoplax sp. H2]|eukprot:RDD39691.1 Rhodopsin, GQ-coupled [Trichoplax sp. H2]
MESNNTTNPQHMSTFTENISLFNGIFIVPTILGILGNSLVFRTIYTWDKYYTPTYILMANMAISDLITLVASLAYSIASILSWLFNASLSSWPITCRVLSYLITAFHGVSSLSLTAISYDRFNTIVQASLDQCPPFFRRKKALSIVLSSIWIAGMTLALPYPWIITIDSRLPYICEIGQIINTANLVLYSISCLFSTFLPSLIIVILYIKVVLFIHRKWRVSSSLSAKYSKDEENKKKDVLKMLIVTTTIAIIFTLPHIFVYVIVTVFNSTLSNVIITLPLYLRYLLYFTYKFSVMACAHSPLIYSLMNRKFRHDMKITFRQSCNSSTSLNAKTSHKVGVTTVVTTCDDHVSRQNFRYLDSVEMMEKIDPL